MKIACVGYRSWALEIYDTIVSSSEHDFIILRSKAEYDEKIVRDFNPEIILFYGWSWIISEEVLKNYKCIMLHPSELPKYRGGSPLQNQILDGLERSAVTLFLMEKELDAGPILKQKEFSLKGLLKDIFSSITEIGIELTQDILENGMQPIEQDHRLATYCQRRKPEESEITLEELTTKDSLYLYNKIRMLQSPYPNAFIKTMDGKKLFIKEATLEKDS